MAFWPWLAWARPLLLLCNSRDTLGSRDRVEPGFSRTRRREAHVGTTRPGWRGFQWVKFGAAGGVLAASGSPATAAAIAREGSIPVAVLGVGRRQRAMTSRGISLAAASGCSVSPPGQRSWATYCPPRLTLLVLRPVAHLPQRLTGQPALQCLDIAAQVSQRRVVTRPIPRLLTAQQLGELRLLPRPPGPQCRSVTSHGGTFLRTASRQRPQTVGARGQAKDRPDRPTLGVRNTYRPKHDSGERDTNRPEHESFLARLCRPCGDCVEALGRSRKGSSVGHICNIARVPPGFSTSPLDVTKAKLLPSRGAVDGCRHLITAAPFC